MTGRCATCGGPQHPRLIVRQAIHVPERRSEWRRYAVAVASVLFFILVVSLGGPM